MNSKLENILQMPEQSLPEWIKLSCEKYEPVGSRVTCSPAPTDTDQDWLCLLLANMNLHEFVDVLAQDGWEQCVGEDGEPYPIKGSSSFISVRKEVDNLIITQDKEYYDRFMVATGLAKRFNLLKKDDRVALFEAITRPKQPEKKKSSLKFGVAPNPMGNNVDALLGALMQNAGIVPNGNPVAAMQQNNGAEPEQGW